MRNGSDAPRGPRSQFDGPSRGPPVAGPTSNVARPSLRDAPPLGTGARPFRERDYIERRERTPPARERSPPRNQRDFQIQTRDIDVRSGRRPSREGPPSAGSNYSDNPPFSSSAYSRGGFRGRGRGDFSDFRGGGRGGRRALDERGGDLFSARRDRSPPRFGRDLSRDGRDPERRDDRRFDRREDERRPEWERDRELDRARRDQVPARLESRASSDNVPGANATHSVAAAPQINPERLAIIESSGADTGLRRSSTTGPMLAPGQRRDPPSETPAYLNGRADAAAQRYSSRGSSPPTQAPPVPAFSFSIAPSSASHQAPPKAVAESRPAEARPAAVSDFPHAQETPHATVDDRPAPPSNAPTAPKGIPVAPKAYHADPPPMAPRAPRALELDTVVPPSNRLHGVRSLENMPAQSRGDAHQTHPPLSMPPSPGTTRAALPQQGQPISPNPPQAPRFDLAAPTGPKAVRGSAAQASLSPRPPFTSPRSDTGAFQSTIPPRTGTPPLTAPAGPRRQSFSVSPKVAVSNVPTAPKAARVPPMMPRAGAGLMPALNRPSERPPFAPSGPRNHLQWNQWRRPQAGSSTFGDKVNAAVPAKRDANGDEKEKQDPGNMDNEGLAVDQSKYNDDEVDRQAELEPAASTKHEDRMAIDSEHPKRKSSTNPGQPTTHASFFGGTLPRSEQAMIDSSDEEDDELDEDEDATLLEAKHARRERELRAQLHDLSAPQFRATSPLESIARLARLSWKDLERAQEQRHDPMDTGGLENEATRGDMPSATHSSGSEEGPEVATPRAAQDESVIVREAEDDIMADAPRRRSPEPISLPYLLKGDDTVPFQETEMFQETAQDIEEENADFAAVLEDDFTAERNVEQEVDVEFAEFYMQWREECEALDRIRQEQEKLERQLSAEPGPVVEAPVLPVLNPIMEGRRLHKNSSEYEIERVIKESEETARVEREKLEREAKKVMADMEKEARLPDMKTEVAFIGDTLVNANRLRDPTKLLRVFSYEPPPDTFTEHEQDVFIAAFKDTPKKFGEIASLLEGRTYKDCIHHYYANKWDGRFRENKKKMKGSRRGGRGGKMPKPSRGSALMADLNRGEDLTQDTSTGRPKRAAAPTTFGEREVEAKSSLAGPSPAKKPGPGSKQDGTGDDKPAKKQRRTGEGKPGRKPKPPPATLAAAPGPSMSPHKHHAPQLKEEALRMGRPSLDEANLLAHLHSGNHPMMQHDSHLVFSQDGMQPHANSEEMDAGRPLAPSAKQSASSYWSVPEQNDFKKHIAHFGTDFSAISAHMGTKTQTMIKNHYQRQVDGGQSGLAELADQADQRRARGEDMGPPPTPTPITKRKYDNPQTSTPRALAPQNDAMDIDEPGLAQRPPTMLQGSPPQLQNKPRFSGSSENTPIQSQRVVPSPMPHAAMPATSMPPTLPPNRVGLPYNALGSRFGMHGDRPESRPSVQSTSMFPVSQGPSPVPPRSQPPPPLARTLSNAPPAEFLQSLEHNLRAEQDRAFAQQRRAPGMELLGTDEHDVQLSHGQSHHGQALGQSHGQHRPHMNPFTQGSPINLHQSLTLTAMPPDRQRGYEERVGTPSRDVYSSALSRGPALVNPNPSAGSEPRFGIPTMSGLARGYHPSPPKLESARPGSVPTSGPSRQPPMPAQTPASAPTPAPEPTKKSNIMNLLNDEPAETKPPVKRDSLPSAGPTRVASPAQPFSSAPTPQPMSNISAPRFGQHTTSLSQFHRGSFGQPLSTPGPAPANLKQESSNGSSSSLQQTTKHDWPRGMMHGSNPSPPAPAPLDRDPRDGRPGYSYPPSHRTVLSSLNPSSRANPSPPPTMHSHSRNSSLTQPAPSQREQQRSMLGTGPPTTQAQLHANPYARQEQLPFSQAPPQAPNRAHHSHTGSTNQGASLMDRYRGNQSYMSRDEEQARAYQHQQQQRHQHEHQQRMEHDNVMRERERADAMQMDDLRRRDAFYNQRGPPMQSQQPMQPYGGINFAGGRQPLGLREISRNDTEAAMLEQHRREREQIEQERMQFGEQRALFNGRERDAPMDRYGQRPPDDRQTPVIRRQTPQNNGFPGSGFPPPRRG